MSKTTTGNCIRLEIRIGRVRFDCERANETASSSIIHPLASSSTPSTTGIHVVVVVIGLFLICPSALCQQQHNRPSKPTPPTPPSSNNHSAPQRARKKTHSRTHIQLVVVYLCVLLFRQTSRHASPIACVCPERRWFEPYKHTHKNYSPDALKTTTCCWYLTRICVHARICT